MTAETPRPRGWVKRIAALVAPGVVEIDVRESVAGFSTDRMLNQIELPLLHTPDLDHGIFSQIQSSILGRDLSSIPVGVALEVLDKLADAPATTDAKFSVLAVPDNANWRFALLDQHVTTVDLFVALVKPMRAGKAYGSAAAQHGQQSSFFRELQQNAFVDFELGRCRHGLPKSTCQTCAREHQQAGRAKSNGTRTVDVFQLLLPYLQPPLQPLLAKPALFPVGHRPFDYQVRGIKFLSERPAALLGDEMGLGKTVQAIIALQVLYRKGYIRRTLILCPRSLLGNWERELEHWAPELYVLRVRGNPTERHALWKAPSSVFLTTYETVRQDIDDVPEIATRFDVVILDEVQKIKNAGTGMARAVHRLRATYRWGLSGTPLENRLEDVTSIYAYLKPGLFRTDELFTPEIVKQRIIPHFLRRRTADVRQELPDKVIQEVWLELTDSQQATYEQTEVAGKQELMEPGATRVHVFALINKLKQICNLDSGSGESCKANYLEDQLDSIIESGEKAIVFSHLPTVSLAKLTPRLQDFSPAMYDGSLSDARRRALEDAFRDAEYPKVLLMSVQTGGVGLNLQRANHVFHFDHWWNPAVARQAEGRAHRIGQTRTVFVHDIYTVGTIEERIYSLLKQKQALFDTVIDDLSAEYVKGTITDSELFGLFGLKPPTDPRVVVSSQPTSRINEVYTTLQTSIPAFGIQQETTKRLDDARTGSSASSSTSKVQLESSNSPVAQPGTVRRNLDDLTPSEFERVISQLYSRMGFKTSLTPASRDHGVDIFGVRLTELGAERIIVQCKHTPSGTVGEPIVRDLVGTWQEHRNADKAILVTSGHFSQEAIEYAGRHRVQLVDRSDLAQLLLNYSEKRGNPLT